VTPQFELVLSILGLTLGLTYCVIRVVGDLRAKRHVFVALGTVTALVLLRMAWFVYLLAGL
jgi:hypothetical protein